MYLIRSWSFGKLCTTLVCQPLPLIPPRERLGPCSWVVPSGSHQNQHKLCHLQLMASYWCRLVPSHPYLPSFIGGLAVFLARWDPCHQTATMRPCCSSMSASRPVIVKDLVPVVKLFDKKQMMSSQGRECHKLGFILTIFI